MNIHGAKLNIIDNKVLSNILAYWLIWDKKANRHALRYGSGEIHMRCRSGQREYRFY